MVMNGTAVPLEVHRERHALPVSPQPSPGISHQIGRRDGRVNPEQSRVLARLAVNRLAGPPWPRREEPSHPRLTTRPTMMHNGHAPDLIRTQKDSRFLLGLAERGLKNILSSLDVPARRAQQTRG